MFKINLLPGSLGSLERGALICSNASTTIKLKERKGKGKERHQRPA